MLDEEVHLHGKCASSLHGQCRRLRTSKADVGLDSTQNKCLYGGNVHVAAIDISVAQLEPRVLLGTRV